MGKRRHTKNKKRKMIGGAGGEKKYPEWKKTRDLYDPVHKTILPPKPEQKPAEKESEISFSQRATPIQNFSRSPRQPGRGHTKSESQLVRMGVDSMTLGNTIGTPVNHDDVISSRTLKIESDVDQSSQLSKPTEQWTLRSLYRGGARRKSKSSKKKRKQKRKTQKRKSSNKRKYTKRR
jgi:hypothetical protein